MNNEMTDLQSKNSDSSGQEHQEQRLGQQLLVQPPPLHKEHPTSQQHKQRRHQRHHDAQQQRPAPQSHQQPAQHRPAHSQHPMVAQPRLLAKGRIPGSHLEIIPIGGYGEVGRNSVAIRVDDEIVILDLGLNMEKYVEYTDSDEIVELSGRKLIEIGAAPDVNILGDEKKNVKGILLTHAHLDHIGAVPFLANRFDCDVHATPFTIELVRKMFDEEERLTRGKLVSHEINERFRVGEKIEAEFINITHSVPQAVMILLHTPYGKVMYANDFKFDNNPTLGPKPNYARLRELTGQVDYLILDSLYAEHAIKTPSEKIAEEMLKDVLLGTQSRGATIIVTTFSSHIARLRAIVNVAKLMKRKPVFLGRSLQKIRRSRRSSRRRGFQRRRSHRVRQQSQAIPEESDRAGEVPLRCDRAPRRTEGDALTHRRRGLAAAHGQRHRRLLQQDNPGPGDASRIGRNSTRNFRADTCASLVTSTSPATAHARTIATS